MNNLTTTLKNLTNLTNLTNPTTIIPEVENILIMEILFSIPIFLILILVVFYCDKENKENIKRTCIVKNNKIIPYNYIDNYNSIIINTSTNSE